MRTSSTSQLEFDHLNVVSPLDVLDVSTIELDVSTIEAPSSSSGPSRMPEFASSELYAIASRIAGRLNAASVSDQEHKTLLHERQVLLDKKFDGTITREGENRLEYVRWSLDRIEDAKYGAKLDALEGLVSAYEGFSSDVQMLGEHLQQHLKKKRK